MLRNYFKMKKCIHRFRQTLIIVCFFSFIVVTNAQNTTLSLSQVTSCPGNQVTVSLSAVNLLNVGAISLYIGYDTAVLEYLGHGNTNPQFPGIMSNAVTQPQAQVGIAWSSLTAGSITNGILLDLYFKYKQDSCWLTFNPGCEIVNADLVLIVFDPVNGNVSTAPPYITQNAQNVLVTEGEDALFQVIASGADVYQWQEWNGTAWSDIANNVTYQDVNTAQFTITAAPMSLNEHWYRCFLEANAGCQVFSDSAQLLVMPVLSALLVLPDTTECAFQQISVPLMGFGLDNIIDFSIEIAYNPEVASFLGLANISPLLPGISASVFNYPVPHVTLTWSADQAVTAPDGNLLEMVFDFITGSTALIIMNTSYITREDMSLYTIEAHNGSITENQHPVILESPSDTTVISGDPAYFSTLANGAIAFQWFESQDQGISWALLNDSDPYSGSQTSILKIDNVTTDFTLFKYKCLVAGTMCEAVTDAATLTVDTLINTSVLEMEKPEVVIFTIQSQKITNEKLSVVFIANEAGILSTTVFDISGRIINKYEYTVCSRGEHSFEVKLNNRKSGIYIIEYTLVNNSKFYRDCRKAYLK